MDSALTDGGIIFVRVQMLVFVCMYDYHIASSVETLAPFESMCACVVRVCVYL